MAAAKTEDPPARSRLLLLDGHSLAYRAFFALPVENFSTTTGQPTNAVYGFTAMLINVLRDESPTHVAVTFDVSKSTFRTETYADYKAGRAETPTDFKGQVSLVREVLDALRVPIVCAEGFEADDVIATLATQAEADGMDVLIVTGDRDAFQLVSERVTVLYNARGVSDMRRMTPDAVQEKYGLSPAQYPEFAALRGDPSDNLPGIPGLGEKTATKLIQQYGDIGSLVDHVDEVKGKVGDNLRAGLSSVVRNRQLTELVRDVPLDVHPADLRLGQWDRDEVHEVFDALQFRVLRERLYATLSAVEPEAEQGFDVAHRKLGPGEVRAWLDGLPRGVRVGVHVRGTWGRGTGDANAIGLAPQSPPDEGEPHEAAFVDLTETDADDDAALGAWLADPSVGQGDARREGPAAGARRPRLGRRRADHATRRSRPTSRCRGRASSTSPTWRCASCAASCGRRSPTTASCPSTARRPTRAPRTPRSAPGPWSTSRSRSTRTSSGAARTALLRDLELPLVAVLADCERTGIAADVDHLVALESRLREQVKEAAEEAYATVGHEFHLGSPEAAAGAAVRRARAAQDQEDQDRLHHRRRRAAEPRRHPPGHRGAAAAPRDDPAADGGREAAAADRRRRRPHPHDLQADGRRDRPAVLATTRTCRTSRSAPSRAARSARASSPVRGSRR